MGQRGVGEGHGFFADPGGHLVAVGDDPLKERLIGQVVVPQVLFQPGQRIATDPGFLFGTQTVFGGIVRGGVSAHAIGYGLDQHRAFAAARPVQGPTGHGQHRKHIVAVHTDPGEAIACRTVCQRDLGLHVERNRDGPLVVLAEEDHRGVEAGGEDHGFVDLALGRGAVAEVGDHCFAVLGQAFGVPAGLVALHGHGISGGMGHLCGEHHGVHVEVVFPRVPAAIGDATEDP
ncbi:hypothetical protein B857_03943 [Solibacillus isronensis B3W22]|uniref:Uncharacterized protein n=1 Tax=Solibacillus isronensis B3W22 TaxID=1224748 RepID=K1KGT4_9BACL|nr:hypothetical protein B857_03943 [Solibacillus isronensis B3W22]